MDFIDPILSTADAIYKLVEKVKANKKRCRGVASRVKDLEPLVIAVKTRKVVLKSKGENAIVEKVLHDLNITLTSARDMIERYTQASWLQRVLKSGSHMDGFSTVKDRLDDALKDLSVALQVEDSNMQYQMSKQQEQDKVDGQKDKEELKSLLLESVQKPQEQMEAMRRDFEEFKIDVNKMVVMLNKPSATDVEIRMIKPEELTYDFSQKPKVTPNSEVYKGEYNRFTVAIKRFIDQADTSVSEIRSIFNKEVDTMKRFESPNILRMFGICVKNEEGPNPEYLIIMEYCEKGSLREVLDSNCELSWIRKARMCLDAAQGLYRLHQTEVKSKVHGCINSSKFLVDEGYRVKLSGFELCKTETSLKKGRNDKEISSLCYSSPQLLKSIDYLYSKECDIYSFGIVMWEIATRQYPCKDPATKVNWTNKEILQRVGKDKYIEPLPKDCPQALGDLINACRAYDSFHRPSAGVLVDKLRSVVTQLEVL